uniref:Endonuclease/exonuclease/phosphatase domain-containing protein n=1 Tax=Pygocentrus nattereri TaxID=42514 RepID=A0AAR2K0X9_PYGNA
FHKRIQFNATNVKSDPFGHFIIVSGLLIRKPVVLVNIYAPNWHDDKFIRKVVSLIPELNSHQLIFRADLNCVINPVLDRSKPTYLNPLKMSKTVLWTTWVVFIHEILSEPSTFRTLQTSSSVASKQSDGIL